MARITIASQGLGHLIRQTPERHDVLVGDLCRLDGNLRQLQHCGYEAVNSNDAGNVVSARKYAASCAL